MANRDMRSPPVEDPGDVRLNSPDPALEELANVFPPQRQVRPEQTLSASFVEIGNESTSIIHIQ